jgi:hypothetical protein
MEGGMTLIRKLAAIWMVNAAVSTVLPALAEDMVAKTAPRTGVPASAVILPGTRYVIVPGAFTIGPEPDHLQRDLINAIVAWLSSEFDLPSIDSPPAITFASARRMIGLRHRDEPSDSWGGQQPDILAIYDDEARTIYLPEGWSGKSPGELSLLVHEIVHHIQNMAGLKFACPEEREKAAFEAQERWLGLFDSDLLTEFGLDPFTLLVRTHCLY